MRRTINNVCYDLEKDMEKIRIPSRPIEEKFFCDMVECFLLLEEDTKATNKALLKLFRRLETVENKLMKINKKNKMR